MKYDYHHVSPEHAKKRFPDYHYVSPEHDAIHKKCENWARYVTLHPQKWMSPIWLLGKSNGRCWEAPKLSIPIRTEEALQIERAIRQLSADQAAALRWCYVYKWTPARQIRAIGCTYEGLYHLIQAGRGNLAIRCCKGVNPAVICRELAREYA